MGKLRKTKLKSAAMVLESGIEEALTYTRFPHEHRLKIRRRPNSVGVFPDGNSALMPVYTGLRYVSSTDRGTKKYLNMEHLYTMEQEETAET